MIVFDGCFSLEELAELGIELLQRVAAGALGAGARPAVEQAHLGVDIVDCWRIRSVVVVVVVVV